MRYYAYSTSESNAHITGGSLVTVPVSVANPTNACGGSSKGNVGVNSRLGIDFEANVHAFIDTIKLNPEVVLSNEDLQQIIYYSNMYASADIIEKIYESIPSQNELKDKLGNYLLNYFYRLRNEARFNFYLSNITDKNVQLYMAVKGRLSGLTTSINYTFTSRDSLDLSMLANSNSFIWMNACTRLRLQHPGCSCSGSDKDINGRDVSTSISNKLKGYLEQNVPNPSSLSTTIKYHLTDPNNPFIKIIDMVSQDMRYINIDEIQNGKVEINISGIEPGVYFYSLYNGGEIVDTKKMLVIK